MNSVFPEDSHDVAQRLAFAVHNEPPPPEAEGLSTARRAARRPDVVV